MSGGCDRQRDEHEAQIDRLRRDRDEALQKASKAAAALVAARENLEAARAEREAAERRIQLAVVAFDALRAAATSERTWIAGLPQWDALERALRGVPAVAPIAIGWGLASVEAGSIEDRLAAVEAMIGSMSDHLAALEQQIAGLGNGLDEVRDPAWFAARFREHMKEAVRCAAEAVSKIAVIVR